MPGSPPGPAIQPSDRGVLSLAFELGDPAVTVIVTTREAGDLRPQAPGSDDRRRRILGEAPWAWTRQVHGATVVDAVEARKAGAVGHEADALVGAASDQPAMFAADCALLGIVSPEGIVAAVHAGWPGLRAGVIAAAAEAMRSRGATRLSAVRGPCIEPECYEFGEADLDVMADLFGSGVRSQTRAGRPALDLAAAVRSACGSAAVEIANEVTSCTGCASSADGSALWFSHRARLDEGRHALVIAPLGRGES